jgi:uncharacterized surface protein with fasciclin (FAS1) repeats
MISFKNRTLAFALAAFAVLAALSACRKDSWDNHGRITDPAIATNVMQAISQDPDLSTFSSYLAKTGYDKVLSSSRTFTVWAPTNEALKSLPDSEVSDTARLRLLVENHIAYQTYFTYTPHPQMRVRTLNGKYVVFSKTQVNDARIVAGDEYTGNGVLHKIDKPLIPQMNAWQYLNSAQKSSLQATFINSLQYMYVDPDSAEQIGVDPQTGVPVYKPGTGLVRRNRYLQKVNLDDEDSVLTYIILTDDAFKAEETSLQPYFQDTTAGQTDSVTKWNVIKDLAFRGAWSPDSLPATLYSANDSVQFHLDKSAIVKTVKVSNGIVYVMNRLNYDMSTKIKPIVLDGPTFYDRQDPGVAYTIRSRRNPNTDSVFQDVYLANYGIAAFWLRYPTLVNSVTYKVYWVAVNDFQTGTFPMRLGFKSHTDTAFADPTNIPYDYLLPYETVGLNDYSEVYLGNYTPSLYGKLDVFLIANNTKSNGQNTLVLTYIKLVPILN